MIDTESPLYSESIASAAWSLALKLSRVLEEGEFYLAGSAGLALHLSHRPISHLDFMSSTHRLLSPGRRDLLQACLAIDTKVGVETARDGFLSLRFACGTGIKLFYYPYPLAAPLAYVETPKEALGPIEVASLCDLGLMKLGAIISRGTKRDFVDLYLLCKELPLGMLLTASEDKFGHVLDFPLQAIKGLADRSMWSGEPLPTLTNPISEGDLVAWLDQEIHQWSRLEIERS